MSCKCKVPCMGAGPHAKRAPERVVTQLLPPFSSDHLRALHLHFAHFDCPKNEVQLLKWERKSSWPPVGIMNCLLALLFTGLLACVSAAPLTDWVDGVAKSFGGAQDGKDPNQPSGGLLSGSCGYGELSRRAWPYWSAAAISPDNFLARNASRLPKGGCGACLQLQCVERPGYEGRCPKNTGAAITVQVVDTCTDCTADKITLHYLAFNQKLADPQAGEVAIRYRQVECAPDSNVTFNIDQYRATEGGYIRLAVEQLAGSAVVQNVELRKSPVSMDRLSVSNSQWIKLGNSYGARWEVSGLPSPPLDMRITGENTAQPLIIRQAVKVAGEAGTFTTPVQFPTAAQPRAITDGTLAANAKLPSPATCQDTLYSYIQQDPNLSMLRSFIDKADAASMLQDSRSSVTLFAPVNSAWAHLPSSINLQDAETLQHVVLFLVAGGQIIMPDSSAMLPEDVERGGIKLVVDTLQGTTLTAVGTPTQLLVSDGSSLTSDAIVVEDNIIVCSSAVNKLSEVPLPFP